MILFWLKAHAWLFGIGGVAGAIIAALRWRWDIRRLQSQDSEGPELVIRHSDHEEAHKHEGAGLFFGNPIVIRNLSKHKNAYNVEVQDLVTPEGRATFSPRVIPYVAAESSASVEAKVEGEGPFSNQSLARLFARGYKDTGTDELMGERSYWLTVIYDDGKGRKFEGKFELLYRHWKRVIREGRVARRRAPDSLAKRLLWPVVWAAVVMLIASILWWAAGPRPERNTPAAQGSTPSTQGRSPSSLQTPTEGKGHSDSLGRSPSPKPRAPLKNPPKRAAQAPVPEIEQHGPASGAVGGGITTGPCSAVQVGGSANQSNINCVVVRSLTTEEKAELVQNLRRAPPGTVTVWAVESEDALGSDIYDAFRTAGWKMQESDVQNMFLAQPMHEDIDIFIHGKPDSGPFTVSDPTIVNLIHSIGALTRFKSAHGVSDHVLDGVIKISVGPPVAH